MTVRWSPEAAADLAAIVEYIRKQNLSAAERVTRQSQVCSYAAVRDSLS
jgi:plasmid stabilization system protein ParE